MSDLIRRKSIKNLLCDLHIDNISINGKHILEFIDELPTVDAKSVVHGRWIHDINNMYGCSICMNRETMSPKKMKNFCPNCGAYMKKGE